MSYFITKPILMRQAPELDVGVTRWKQGDLIYPLQLVDRTGLVRFPYQLSVYPRMAMPGAGPTLTYEQCCSARAMQLVRMSNETGLPLAVMWSGGIDSTVVLVSLLKHIATPEQLMVLMDRNSFAENREFYRRFIKDKLRVESVWPMNKVVKADRIVVTGELNDQLFGFDLSRAPRDGHKVFRLMHEPYRPQTGIGWLMKMGMTIDAARKWYEVVDYSARNAPCEVVTLFDLLWWVNFAWKWQYVSLRLPARQNGPAARSLLINGHMQHFFDSDPFQRWSMAAPHAAKIGMTWPSYKRVAKKIIVDFDHNEDYFRNKVKRPSGKLMGDSTPFACEALGSNLTFLNQVDLSTIYDPANHWL
jgi:hypothetical protein